MIIGYDASRAFIDNRTGTENYSYQLLKHLGKIDKKNTYNVYVSPRTSGKLILPKNFKYHVIGYYRLWTQMGLAVQTFKDNLDILFVPAHTLPVFRKPGLKTVITVHDLGSEYLPQMHQLKQKLYLSYMQKVQLRRATKIIVVSNATKTDLTARVGIDSRKIEVIYEGYDKDLFKPIEGDVLRSTLKQLDLVPGEYLLFVGTVQPRKNLKRLIKAFHSVILRTKSEGRLKLVIVGSKGWLADDIYALPAKLGIADKVRFLGRVDDRFLTFLYSGAIALTFPSLFEGFGLPIIEAQACGCPVITSNLSSMPEVADKGAIFVDAYDIESISKAMLEVTSNKLQVTSLKKAGFKNIKRFSWEKCARETVKVFEGLTK